MIVRENSLRACFMVASIAAVSLCCGCGTQVGIAAAPSELFVEVGGATTVNVIALMDTGPPRAAPGELTITSSDTTVAGVSGRMVTGVAEGSVTLAITDGTFTTTASVTVVSSGSIPAGLVIAPTSLTCTSESEPIQLEVFAVFSSGSSENITDAVAFGSNNSPVAVVTPEGAVFCVSPGMAVIRADYLGRSGSAEVTVGALPPTSVTLIPAFVTCVVGETASVQVLAVEADGSSTDASQMAGYTSSDSLVATASAGQIDCLVEGSATITANVSGVLGTVEVEVGPATPDPDEVVALRFTPPSLTCTLTGFPAFVLTAEFGDGSTEDVTNDVGTVYQSSDSNVVLVLDNQLVCVQTGVTTIRAEFASFQASATVTVQ